MRYLLITLTVFAVTATAFAQFTISASQNRVGSMGTLDLSGGIPNSSYVVLADIDPTSTSFPTIGLTVDLGFSSALTVFEPGFIGPSGTGSQVFGFNQPSVAGVPFYAQALNVDPLDIFNIVPSNQIKTIVHGPSFTGGTTTAVTLSDDGSQLVDLGFSFPFYGQSYTQVYVNANGNMTFGAPSSSFFVDEGFFLAGPPRIAPFWSDLNPNVAGTISTDTTLIPGTAFSVVWNGLFDNLVAGASSATVTLFFNGDIMVEYANVDVAEPIAGITPGGASTTNDVDLNAPGFEFHTQGLSVYQVFTGANSFDMDNSVLSFAYNNNQGYMVFF